MAITIHQEDVERMILGGIQSGKGIGGLPAKSKQPNALSHSASERIKRKESNLERQFPEINTIGSPIPQQAGFHRAAEQGIVDNTFDNPAGERDWYNPVANPTTQSKIAKRLERKRLGLQLNKTPLPNDDHQEDAPEIPTEPVDQKIDLKSMVMSFVEHLGDENAAKFFEKNASTIHRWKSGSAQPGLDAAQKILDKRPDAVKKFREVLAMADVDSGKTVLASKEKLNVMIGRCVKGDINPYVDYSHLYYVKRYDVGMSQQIDTLVIRSRNLLTQTFLNSGYEWLWMLDSDVILPIENSAWFDQIGAGLSSNKSGMNILTRLMSHEVKFVGGVYAGRKLGSTLITQPDLNPQSNKDVTDSDAIRAGKARGIRKVDWVATGCMLIHRDVFLDVRAKYSHLEPKNPEDPFPFFTPDADNTGEDISFCKRVIDSGQEIYLDQECVVGHIGRIMYLPHHSRPLKSI